MSIVTAAVWISLFCCVALVAISWIEGRSKSRPRRQPSINPEQILAERFARGELDELEYGQRLSVLRVGPPLHTYLER
jgi:putative membrane protein